MACWSAEPADDGFATPAATMISLALGLSAAAAVSASLGQLRLARADFAKDQAENTLDGVHQRAIFTLLSSAAPVPLRWSQAIGETVKFEVTAEPETAKASLASVTVMDDSALASLGVTDPMALKERLKTFTIDEALGPSLEAADPSPRWKACARSMVSPFGLGDQLQWQPRQAPVSDVAARHAGEIWRLRVRDSSGWVDDRVIRLTGDGLHPAATLERQFSRLGQEGDSCGSMFEKAR